MDSPIYKYFSIPESCLLEKRIYKKMLFENTKLSAHDRKIITGDIDRIYWMYTLKPSTIPIHPYDDNNREYHEVAFIHVNLLRDGRVSRVAEIIHRAIPYPLVIVFKHENLVNISVAYKRFSQAEKEAVVAEGFQNTDWIDLDNPTQIQTDFLKSLKVSAWTQTNFYTFYKAAVERIVALKCATYNSEFALISGDGKRTELRTKVLQQIESSTDEKNDLVRQLQGEKNLGTQVELNTKIRQITDRIQELIEEL